MSNEGFAKAFEKYRKWALNMPLEYILDRPQKYDKDFKAALVEDLKERYGSEWRPMIKYVIEEIEQKMRFKEKKDE